MSAFVYIVRCADGSFYVGSTRASLEQRIGEHNGAKFIGFTATRRPVELVFHQEFDRISDAVSAERQIKKWRREKKQALIEGRFDLLPALARTAKPSSGS